jgi:hypothetical protein
MRNVMLRPLVIHSTLFVYSYIDTSTVFMLLLAKPLPYMRGGTTSGRLEKCQAPNSTQTISRARSHHCFFKRSQIGASSIGLRQSDDEWNYIASSGRIP